MSWTNFSSLPFHAFPVEELPKLPPSTASRTAQEDCEMSCFLSFLLVRVRKFMLLSSVLPLVLFRQRSKKLAFPNPFFFFESRSLSPDFPPFPTFFFDFGEGAASIPFPPIPEFLVDSTLLSCYSALFGYVPSPLQPLVCMSRSPEPP